MKLFAPRTVAAELHRRRVRLLLHSTHLYVNLPLILAAGMLHSVRLLRELYGPSAGRFLHDPRRYEQLAVGLDYLNATLTQPNVPLLYHRSKSDWKDEWVHLSLRLELLGGEDVLFCPVSAAAGYGRHLQPGLAGLQAMFAESVDGHSRDGLPRDLPTHPQAEVLLRAPLPLSEVLTIFVPSDLVAREVERLCTLHHRTIPIEAAPQLFVWPSRLLPKH